jgi:hypothetical protein
MARSLTDRRRTTLFEPDSKTLRIVHARYG